MKSQVQRGGNRWGAIRGAGTLGASAGEGRAPSAHLLAGVGLGDGYALLPCDGGDGFQGVCRILNDQVHRPVEGLFKARSKIAR